MSHLLYNWQLHSASKSLLLNLNNINTETTKHLSWALFFLLIVFAVTSVFLWVRLQRSRKEVNHLLQQFDRIVSNRKTASAAPIHPYTSTETVAPINPQEMTPAANESVVSLTNHTAPKTTIDIQNKGFFDPLTQLPNRKALEAALSNELEHCTPENRSALLILKVNNLRRINDSYGRNIGDNLLQHVAQRLRRMLGKEDILARLNSSKFAIVVKKLPHPNSTASELIRKHTTTIQKNLESPYLIGSTALQGQISIGVAYLESPTLTVQDILQRAHIALEHTPNHQGLRVKCFSTQLSTQIKEIQQLSAELPQAIEKGEMKIVVQPQHCFNGELIGVELLMRWQHPTLGEITPDRFIPLAEKENYIHTLGLWVLEQAYDFIKQNNYPDLSVSINVSPLQFHSIHFPEFIDLLVNYRACMGHRLIIELTEGTIMENIKESSRTMRFLNQLGYRFALDDFGTGYSNLAAISSCPLYGLKLDRSLVANIHHDANLRTIAKMVASLARSLNLHSIAEGVEKQEELEVLRELSFDAAQGFYLSRPLTLNDWPTFLAQARIAQLPNQA